jgi:hypothetical protein
MDINWVSESWLFTRFDTMAVSCEHSDWSFVWIPDIFETKKEMKIHVHLSSLG